MGRREDQIREAAYRLGFHACGFARLGTPPHATFVRDWLAAGHAADMAYLGRGVAKRLDPGLVLPGARSVISVGVRYRSPRPFLHDWRRELRGRVAAYAYGPDYHDTLGEMLERLADDVRGSDPLAGVRAYVDTGPVLEREWAVAAGLGWFGKNTNLLRIRDGSWLLLGEVLTTLDLDPDPLHPDRCGTCTRCVDVCPTAALGPGYTLDARLCISYWTIEHRGTVPRTLRPRFGNWVFGCDECQSVCPWNEDEADEAGDEVRDAQWPRLLELLALDDDAFRRRYRGTAVRRTGRAAMARNAAIALGNSGNADAVPALGLALRSDPAWLVRAHAAWALGRLGGAAARAALDRAYTTEASAAVRIEIVAAL